MIKKSEKRVRTVTSHNYPSHTILECMLNRDWFTYWVCFLLMIYSNEFRDVVMSSLTNPRVNTVPMPVQHELTDSLTSINSHLRMATPIWPKQLLCQRPLKYPAWRGCSLDVFRIIEGWLLT